MISTKHRFHGHHSLDFIYKRGKTIRGEMLGLRYLPAKNQEYRLSVVVSKKVSKSAVVRNRIRRRIYEAVRKTYKETSPKPYDMIISVYDARFAENKSTELQKSILGLIEKTLR